MSSPCPALPPLRIFCLEDNPLIACHLEQMIEDLGHVFCGSADSFEQLVDRPPVVADVALVDIDLADGSTGPDAARWLRSRGVPVIFATGQRDVAAHHADIAVATLVKPIFMEDLRRSLDVVRADS